jgi:hypothetical protein
MDCILCSVYAEELLVNYRVVISARKKHVYFDRAYSQYTNLLTGISSYLYLLHADCYHL